VFCEIARAEGGRPVRADLRCDRGHAWSVTPALVFSGWPAAGRAVWSSDVDFCPECDKAVPAEVKGKSNV
jgi:hypothetical protein